MKKPAGTMGIQILMIGRIKHPALAAATADYLARIERLHSCRLRHLRASRYTDEEKNGGQILAEEGAALLAALPPGTFSILMDRPGRAMDSPQFSRFLEQTLEQRREAVFIIGGFLGVSQAVRERADVAITLSNLTFPHEVALLVLAEQIYRALTMIKKIPYHK